MQRRYPNYSGACEFLGSLSHSHAHAKMSTEPKAKRAKASSNFSVRNRANRTKAISILLNLRKRERLNKEEKGAFAEFFDVQTDYDGGPCIVPAFYDKGHIPKFLMCEGDEPETWIFVQGDSKAMLVGLDNNPAEKMKEEGVAEEDAEFLAQVNVNF